MLFFPLKSSTGVHFTPNKSQWCYHSLQGPSWSVLDQSSLWSSLLLLNLVQSCWLSFCFWNILPLIPVSGPAFLRHSIYNYVALHYICLFACGRSPSTPRQWEWTSFALFTGYVSIPRRTEPGTEQTVNTSWMVKNSRPGRLTPQLPKRGRRFPCK